MDSEIKNLTVRIDSDTRKKLKIIAEREVRPLSNQMLVFIREGINRYAEENHLEI